MLFYKENEKIKMTVKNSDGIFTELELSPEELKEILSGESEKYLNFREEIKDIVKFGESILISEIIEFVEEENGKYFIQDKEEKTFLFLSESELLELENR